MLLITGMHRSGTSLVAKLFYEDGADLGESRSFYPGDKWNPDGYYEQPEIHSLNMRLIHGSWGRLAYFRLPSEKTILRRAEQEADRIKNLISKYRNCVVKETRFCMTLKAWIAQGAQIRKILVLFREPIEVAFSLKKRNHIPLSLGLRLWVEHYKRLFTSSGTIPLHLISYNSLLDSETSQKEIAAAYRFMGFDPTAIVDNIQSKIVAPRNKNSVYQHYSREVKDVWGELNKRHQSCMEAAL